MTKKDEALKLALEHLKKLYGVLTIEEIEPVDKAITALREALAEPTTTENNGGKTGWPAGLLQDDDKQLSKWLASKPDARQKVRDALAEQPQEPKKFDPNESFAREEAAQARVREFMRNH